MNSKQIQESLEGILTSSESEKHIAKLLVVIPALDDDSLNEIMLYIKQVISSKNQPYGSRIQILNFLRQLMIKEIPCIFSYTNKRICLKLLSFLPLEETYAGFDIWIEMVSKKEKGLFELFVLTLQCIEAWAEANTTDSRGKLTQLYTVYQGLKAKEIEFPPTYLFQTSESLNENLKRDLHRTRKLCKELRKSLGMHLKKKSKTLKDFAEIYQRQLELEIEKYTKNGVDVGDDLLLTYSELTEVISLYYAWKNHGYRLEDKHNILLNICGQIDEVCPKKSPSPDILSISLELLAQQGQNSPLREDPRQERDSTFREEIDTSSDYFYRLREKLMDTEDLVQMYKADLEKLQVKYLEVTEQKEEMMLRINAILFSNREMNKILSESKKAVETLTIANYALNEDVEAYKSQSECLKASIREIQDSMIKMEKECYKNKKYIEHLENGNTALASSNQTLKFELEKSRSNEKALFLQMNSAVEVHKPQSIPQIFMNPKLVGDTENSYNISISDSENERSYISDEEEKNQPNPSSVKLNHSLSHAEEMCFNAIPNMEISKPKKIPSVNSVFKGDNLLWYRHFLKGTEGLIFEDDKLQIGCKLDADDRACWGKLSFANKTLVGLDFTLIIISIPEGLGSVLIPSGTIHILPSEILFFDVYAELSFPYTNPPLIKLSYRNTLTEKFLRLPIAFPIFCTPLAKLTESYNSLKEYSITVAVKKLYKGLKNIEELARFCIVHKNFNCKAVGPGSILLGTRYDSEIFTASVSLDPDRNSSLELRCGDQILRKILTETLLNQLENI